jgi:hypothetical protein
VHNTVISRIQIFYLYFIGAPQILGSACSVFFEMLVHTAST